MISINTVLRYGILYQKNKGISFHLINFRMINDDGLTLITLIALLLLYTFGLFL